MTLLPIGLLTLTGPYMATIKQFGQARETLTYLPRIGAYGILEKASQDGPLYACARIGYSDFTYDLPGGAVDPGETPDQAVVREFGEETGLLVEVVNSVTEILHYFIHVDGTPYNNHCHFFEMRLLAERPEAKVEADHELVWLTPLQVFLLLKNEGYAWAFLVWLRAKGKG